MKLDLDCMRSILLEVEKQPFNHELRIKDLENLLENYSHDELEYTCLKLQEANFINAKTVHNPYSSSVIYVLDLTYAGHQFLDEVRADNIWDKTKNIFSKIGASSVSAAAQIGQRHFNGTYKKRTWSLDKISFIMLSEFLLIPFPQALDIPFP